MIETVDCILKYIDLVRKYKSEGFEIYRGQQFSKSYNLLPNMLRLNSKGQRNYSNKCDLQFLNHFKARSAKYIEYLPKNDWEWMFIAQHYQLPTRLLDWSESPLVALFFALENAQSIQDENPIVWILNPYELNLLSLDIDDRIPNLLDDDKLINHINTNFHYTSTRTVYPIAISGIKNNVRVESQQGLFTLFPVSGEPLDKLDNSRKFLKGIEIEKEFIEKIKRDLFLLGIKNSSIYPELSSIAKDIVFEYNVLEESAYE